MMSQTLSTVVLTLFAVLLGAVAASADTARDDQALTKLSGQAAFAQFIEDFRATAVKKGIPAPLYDREMRGLSADPEVEKRANNQPEFDTPIWQYLQTRVNAQRIATGREMKNRHAALIRAIEARYGVDRHIFLAIWGIESNFGSHKGELRILRSLATIAYQGRRTEFGRSQLVAALKILQHGDISSENFTGSWAGAMGHTQFIPTTYNAHAVDWTGDGKRDIWNSVADALASTASYLKKSGWQPSRPWGWEVKLPARFDYEHSDPARRRTVAKWKKLGVLRANGKPFGHTNEVARLILPAGAAGPAFLITGNFKAILAYNASISYALAVSHLADRIRGDKPFIGAWPITDLPLNLSQRREMQKILTAMGYDTRGTKGRIGPGTRAAIRSFQKKHGLKPDGYASVTLLEKIRNAK